MDSLSGSLPAPSPVFHMLIFSLSKEELKEYSTVYPIPMQEHSLCKDGCRIKSCHLVSAFP